MLTVINDFTCAITIFKKSPRHFSLWPGKNERQDPIDKYHFPHASVNVHHCLVTQSLCLYLALERQGGAPGAAVLLWACMGLRWVSPVAHCPAWLSFSSVSALGGRGWQPSLWGTQYGGLLGSFQPCLGSKRRKNLNTHREPLHSAHKDLRMLPSDNFPLSLSLWFGGTLEWWIQRKGSRD